MHSYDLWPLCVAALRHTLGRHDTLSKGVADALARSWVLDGLTGDHRRHLACEIEEELRRAEAAGGVLGYSADHAAWKKLAEALRGEAR